jgi:hypothetical protein
MRILQNNHAYAPLPFMNNKNANERAQKIQYQAQAKEREMKMREYEEKRIQILQKQIDEIYGSEIDEDLKKAKIAFLSNMIAQIYENRAKREADAMAREADALAREAEKFQREMEEKMREREKANEHKRDADTDETVRREDTRQMAAFITSNESVKQYGRIKAGMTAEASQLKRDIDNDYGYEQIGLYLTIRVKRGYDNLNDFKNQQLMKLSKGIAGLNAAIYAKISGMYRKNAEINKTDNQIHISGLRQPDEDEKRRDEESPR